eukprot:756115-Hanusia_phi.AAC.1
MTTLIDGSKLEGGGQVGRRASGESERREGEVEQSAVIRGGKKMSGGREREGEGGRGRERED